MSSAMEPAGTADLVAEYREYLARFEGECGEQDFGAFVKHNGRLVKKMRYDEFEPVYLEYYKIAKTYFTSVDRGDTINDVVVKILRDRARELLLTSPV
jgi:hypothetical protein